MGDWKGRKREHFKKKNANESVFELYNLVEDLGETENLVCVYPKIAEKIRRIMVEGRTMAVLEKFRFWEYCE